MEPIDLKTAREMVARYKQTRKAVIDKHHEVNDTESTWLPIDKLKEFINNLPPEATGVRIHFGVHDADHKNAPHQTSVAIVGTVAGKGVDQHIDAIQSDDVASLAVSGLAALKSSKDCPPTCQS
ncbi:MULTISPECIES: hypothetical protein [Mucilaginibacter]|jgi:hypothetical protein|uniref:hypothetical protein n=1 Tax=Mucilaginibacter TaxID=423349 RepID=UPI00159D8CF0|nr:MULTISPECIES: hypothetical protein [Mucilaginibacter]NVM64335.1 ACT domain-containing protein [Mucilaginibacter sp. SG538B]GGB15067.1 hypothetical protein GCM10011500_33980 [Mucilaginibacter rubeus]